MATNDPIRNLEEPRPMLSTWIGVVLLFAAFGLFVLVVVGAAPRGDSYEDKRAKARAEKFKAAQDEATASLTTYGWVDKAKGVARVPINRAMELAVSELAQKKPAPANPIATPAAQPGMQATAPGTPAAPPGSPPPAASATPKATSVSGPESEARAQPAAAANPPAAPPGTQPGPAATPAASPPSAAAQFAPGKGPPSPTPVQSPPGSPLPVRGKTP